MTPGVDGITLLTTLPPFASPIQFFSTDSAGVVTPDWTTITGLSRSLARHDHDFGSLLRSLDSPAYLPGSEFRSVRHLLLRGYNLPEDFVAQVAFGGTGSRLDVSRPIPPQIPLPPRRSRTTEAERKEEQEKFQLESVLCSKGYSIVLLASEALKMRNLRISPFFLKERPGKSPRPLHDLSSPVLEGRSSVNECTTTSSLPELTIGTSLQRLLQFTYSLSLHFPGRPRVLWKFDLAGAFFLFHMNPDDAPFFAYHLDAERKLVVIPCRVSQGSKAGSHICGGLMRAVAEMASSRSSASPSWIPNPPRLTPPSPNSTPPSTPQSEVPHDPLYDLGSLAEDHALSVQDYIDDLFGVGLAEQFANIYRMNLDVIFSALRACLSSESAYRSCPVSQDKFPEAAPTHLKEIVGMIVDVHDLTISIKPSRCLDIVSRLDALLVSARKARGSIHWDAKELERLIGVISFIACYRPRGRAHSKVLTNIIALCPVTPTPPGSHSGDGPYRIKVSHREIQQIADWREYIAKNSPVPIKLVVPRSSTHLGASDSAGEDGTGTGGWHIIDGTAYLWRLQFPSHVTDALTRVADVGTISICDLEFLGVVLNIMVFVVTCATLGIPVSNLVLHSACDNVAAVSWTEGKGPASAAGVFLAKHLDSFLSQHDLLASSSHIRGVDNVLADSLSRDFTLSPRDCEDLALSELTQSSAVLPGKQFDVHSAVLVTLGSDADDFSRHFLDHIALRPRWESPPSTTISSLRLGYDRRGSYGVRPAPLCVNLASPSC